MFSRYSAEYGNWRKSRRHDADGLLLGLDPNRPPDGVDIDRPVNEEIG